MWHDIRNHPWALGIAIVMHVAAAILLLVTFDFEAPTAGASQPAPPSIVEAVAISGAEYDAAVTRLDEARQREREAALAAERRRQEAAEQRRREEQLRQQQAAAEKARQEQQRREAEARQAREAAERKAAEKARQEQLQREAEAKRAAELKRQQELEAQQRREAAERKAEQERMAAALAAEEAALREAERKRAEAEARARLQAQLAPLRDEYMAAIVARIQGNWERPIGAQNNQRARLLVRQARGGFITEVKMLRCEGTEAFCRSVLDAVWRSDPLPAPPRDELFDEELEVEFDPDRS